MRQAFHSAGCGDDVKLQTITWAKESALPIPLIAPEGLIISHDRIILDVDKSSIFCVGSLTQPPIVEAE